MVDTSGIRTDWQNVSEADWQVNNAKAQANRITAEPLNALGQAIIDLSDEVGGGGGGGVTDHGALTGLADDDHPQYLTQLRGDNRYYTKAQTDGLYMPQGGVILADVAHTKTASQNRTALIAAINAAQAVGGTVLLPPVPAGQWILLDGPCPITAGGISVRGAGIRQTRIRQTAWIEPIFDVRAPDVEISNMTCEQGPYGTIDASQFRGEPRTSYNSAVWAGADRVDVHDMRVVNFVSGVHFAAWDVAVGAVRTPLKDCSAHRIQCVSVVFGLLAVGVDGFDWSEITGSYSINGTSTPPHLVYFSDFIGGVSIDNSAVKGGSSRADGGTGSYAYQFKGVYESLIGDLHARGCAGFLYALNCADVTFTALRSDGDTWNSPQYATLEVDGTSSRLRFTDVGISLIGDAKAVRLLDNVEHSLVDDVRVDVVHASSPATQYDIEIRGTGNTVRDPVVRNHGTSPWEAGVGIWAGQDNTISNPKVVGNKRAVNLRTGDGSTVEHYDSRESIAINDGVSNVTLRPNPGWPEMFDTPVVALDRFEVKNSVNWNTLARTLTGQLWVHSAGNWEQFNGEAGTTNVVTNPTALLNLGSLNADVQATILYTNREGLSLRTTDRNNTLVARLNHLTNQAEIMKSVGGTETILASVAHPTTIGGRYTLRAKIVGNQIDLFVDEVKVLSHTLAGGDTTAFTATNFGMRGSANLTFRFGHFIARRA